ncbi:DUF6932 family protein [Lacticaseibacillus paracasei]|uniref:DUF6932 family protein n=1 Tax=Lacticaseibacillus paracasei TaxID=1597 RepID=UPI000515CF96|nr:hypothetical protein [Lacticaseibacillus paracasei]QPB56686.1 hypothetical protein GFB64_06135 [Lacticaseibacillus paracasei]WPQ31757.1 hypothetical protein SH597_05750 [Lacticaseibacillus paracasei]
MLNYNSFGIVDNKTSETMTKQEFCHFFIQGNLNVNLRKQLFLQLNSLFETYLLPLIHDIHRIWIDGSFVSKKPFPSDIDVLVLVTPTADSEPQDTQIISTILDERDEIKCQTNVHLFVIFDYPNIDFSNQGYREKFSLSKNSHNELYQYYKQLFSHTRADKPKTIIELRVKDGEIQ